MEQDDHFITPFGICNESKYYSVVLPNYSERTLPNNNPEVSQGYKKALRKLFEDHDIAYTIHKEFPHFVGSESLGANNDPLSS